MKRIHNEKGVVTVLIAIGMVAMLGMTALVIDYGRIVREDLRLTKAIDAAVLAGAQELPDSGKAEAQAYYYLDLNGFDSSDASFSANSVEIVGEGTKEIKNYFARVLGFESSIVKHRAKAGIYPSVSISSGLKPLYVDESIFSGGDIPTGEVFTLKYDPPGDIKGNFGFLKLEGWDGLNTTKLLAKNFVEGSNKTFSIGETTDTEPGNSNLNFNYESDSSANENAQKIIDDLLEDPEWIIPVIRVIDDSQQGKEEVMIVNFAAFRINTINGEFLSYYENKNIKQNLFNNFDISGEFVGLEVEVGSGDPSASDAGVLSITLIE